MVRLQLSPIEVLLPTLIWWQRFAGWWFGTCLYIFVPHILGMSSSQLLLTPSFFRGVGLNHQAVCHGWFETAPPSTHGSIWIQWIRCDSRLAGVPVPGEQVLPQLHDHCASGCSARGVTAHFFAIEFAAVWSSIPPGFLTSCYSKEWFKGSFHRMHPQNQLLHGYGSIPIHTIFSGMNIHLPAILMFTRGTRFWHTATW